MLKKIAELYKNNQITGYFYSKLEDRAKYLSPDKLEELTKQAKELSKININSEEEHKIFSLINLHVKEIASKINNFGDDILLKISYNIFENRDKFPINNINNFHKAVFEAIKKAYPQGIDSSYIEPSYDTSKWSKVYMQIFSYLQNGWDFSFAFNELTNGWDDMEKRKFHDWCKFYSEGNHLKYKQAQYSDSNMFFPLKKVTPISDSQAIYDANIPLSPQTQEYQRREQERIDIDRKVRAIISRLNAAEKLITDPKILLHFKQEIDLLSWVELLQKLKRDIQTAPIKRQSSTLLEDILLKEANKLLKNGKNVQAEIIKKIAQIPPFEDEGEKKFNEFIGNINFDFNDTNLVVDEDEVEEKEDENEITVTAQAMDIPPSNNVPRPESNAIRPPQIKIPEKPKEDLQDEIKLDGVTIADVISRLELVSNILKNREIPRQLSIVDLMMDKLGIASYFPSLGEATRSALESNQYMFTRIEDILSKLRGSLVPAQEKLELTDETANTEVEAVKEKLREEEQKSEELKEVRKERREQKELGEEMPEELKQPAKIAPPPPPPPPVPAPPQSPAVQAPAVRRP